MASHPAAPGGPVLVAEGWPRAGLFIVSGAALGRLPTPSRPGSVDPEPAPRLQGWGRVSGEPGKPKWADEKGTHTLPEGCYVYYQWGEPAPSPVWAEAQGPSSRAGADFPWGPLEMQVPGSRIPTLAEHCGLSGAR